MQSSNTVIRKRPADLEERRGKEETTYGNTTSVIWIIFHKKILGILMRIKCSSLQKSKCVFCGGDRNIYNKYTCVAPFIQKNQSRTLLDSLCYNALCFLAVLAPS